MVSFVKKRKGTYHFHPRIVNGNIKLILSQSSASDQGLISWYKDVSFQFKKPGKIVENGKNYGNGYKPSFHVKTGQGSDNCKIAFQSNRHCKVD